MTNFDKEQIAKGLSAAAEVIGTSLSDTAAEIMLRDLSRYEYQDVIEALGRCCRECKYKLTLADIVDRLPAGGQMLPAPPLSEFKRKLSESYSSPIPEAQLERIGSLVQKAMIESGYRHFLDFVLERCDKRPTAARVRDLLSEYVTDAAPDQDHSKADCVDCDGTRFVECIREWRLDESGEKQPTGKWRRCSVEEYKATPADWRGSAMCHCHAGYAA